MVKLCYQQASIQNPISRYIKDSLNKLQHSIISCPHYVPYLWQAPVYGHSNKNLRPHTTQSQCLPKAKKQEMIGLFLYSVQ